MNPNEPEKKPAVKLRQGAYVSPRWPGPPIPPVRKPQSPLIISETSMRGATRIPLRPDRALLFTDRAGTVVRLTAYPGLLEARRYDLRFEVDLSRRHSTEQADVPSATLTAHFVVVMDIGWTVTDPAAVVQYRISDGMQIIRPRLLEAVRSIGRTYPIGEYTDFEQHLNRTFGGRGPVFAEGVGVLSCSMAVRPDERHREQLASIDDARHENMLTSVRGSWVDHANSPWELVQEYLRRNPDAIPEVLASFDERRDKGNARDDERFRLLMQSGLVNDLADVKSAIPLSQQPSDDSGETLGNLPPATHRVEPIDVPAVEDVEDDDDDEEVMPAEIVPRDGVKGWVKPPWQRSE